MTVHISIVKSTKKDSKCCMCGKVIPKGSKSISAFGYDYDNERINERVHAIKDCYEEWFGNIDMVEPSDFPELMEIKNV